MGAVLKKYLLVSAIVLQAALLYAQEQPETSRQVVGHGALGPIWSDTASHGVRVSITMNSLAYKLHYENEVNTVDEKGALKDGTSVMVGYAMIKKEGFGAILGGGIQQASFRNQGGYFDGQELGLVKLQADATYGLTPKFYAKAGLNYSVGALKSVSSSESKSVSGIGMQVGAGYQFTHLIGAEVAYQSLNQKNNSEEKKISFEESGAEIGLNLTF